MIEPESIRLKTLLQLTDIRKSFGAVRALKGVSFQLMPGEVHALLPFGGVDIGSEVQDLLVHGGIPLGGRSPWSDRAHGPVKSRV